MRLCITGTPGTGKTTIARLLAKRLGWKLIGLNNLAEEKKLYCGYDKKRKAKIVDIGRIKEEAGKIKEKNIVMESHYAHDMPCDLIIVLRASPKELRERSKKKGWSNEKIMENVEAEIMEVCMQEALDTGTKTMEIDTTGKTPEQTAGVIIKKLGL